MVLWARYSDRTQERTWHVMAAGLLAAVGLLVSAVVSSPLLAMIALPAGVTGIYAFFGTSWAIPPSFLSGKAAAASIAMIISVGQIGGLLGSYLVGWLRQTTNSFTWSFIALAGFFLVAAVLLAGLHIVARLETLQTAALT